MVEVNYAHDWEYIISRLIRYLRIKQTPVEIGRAHV